MRQAFAVQTVQMRLVLFQRLHGKVLVPSLTLSFQRKKEIAYSTYKFTYLVKKYVLLPTLNETKRSYFRLTILTIITNDTLTGAEENSQLSLTYISFRFLKTTQLPRFAGSFCLTLFLQKKKLYENGEVKLVKNKLKLRTF